MDYQINNLNKNTITQEYSTTMLWNPISSIVFTTNILPIYSSQTPPIQIFENGVLKNNSSNFNFLNILTDFIGNDLSFVPYIQYAPTVYRRKFKSPIFSQYWHISFRNRDSKDLGLCRDLLQFLFCCGIYTVSNQSSSNIRLSGNPGDQAFLMRDYPHSSFFDGIQVGENKISLLNVKGSTIHANDERYNLRGHRWMG